MAHNPFGHIDLRVRDLEAALPLYSELMPAVGFPGRREGEGWVTFVGEGEQPGRPFIWMSEEPAHLGNANRTAFWVATRADVDRVAALLGEVGATIESGPRDCPEYWPTYYAVFFRDPSGNALEVYHLLD